MAEYCSILQEYENVCLATVKRSEQQILLYVKGSGGLNIRNYPESSTLMSDVLPSIQWHGFFFHFSCRMRKVASIYLLFTS
jgi:hypothetical protein